MLIQTRRDLEKREKFFFILDNTDSLDDFLGSALGSIDLRPFLPENGDILITTRNPRFLGKFALVSNGTRVYPMEKAEAVALLTDSVLTHLSKSVDKGLIFNLLDELGNLQLALT